MVCETDKITGSYAVGKGDYPQHNGSTQVEKKKDNGELAKELSGKNTNVNTNNNSNVTVVNVNIGEAMGFVRNSAATGHGEASKTNSKAITKEGTKNPKQTENKTRPKSDKKPIEKKATGASNSRTNTGNNGQVIIAGDNNHVVIENGEKVDKTKSAEETKEQKTQKTKENMLKAGKENYSAAYADGAQTAEDLIGYTTTSEKNRVIRHINALTPEKVMGFLSGYYDNDTVAGMKYGVGDILDQIDNENGWTNSERTVAFKKIISNTLQYAKAMGLDQHRINDLQGKLNDLNAGKEIDTEAIDETVKELITEGKALSGV